MNTSHAVLAAALALLTTLVSAPQSVAAGLVRGACAPGAVRIEHAYLLQTEKGLKRTYGDSLGTAATPRIVVTHNHFSHKPEPGRGETLTFVECAGKTVRVPVDRVTFVAVDAGTALIFLPEDVSLASAPVADLKAVVSLAAGSRLTVNYWDDSAGRFAQKDFEVLKVKNGVATLADPDCAINPGDSGGSVYLSSGLVANIWAIYENGQGQATGKFDVALLPAEAWRLLAETAAGAAAGAR